jgi:4-amino-4-deoxy-L-arabinose transferase-like glycosyltransferase
MTFVTYWRDRRLFVGLVAAGLLLRLMILGQTDGLGTMIMDEQHYGEIARNIKAGNGFAWGPGELTSIRPPLYPGLLAAVWSLAGSESLQIIRFGQILLALATSGLVYLLGTRLYGERAGQWAALAVWLYPSLIFFNFLILTETLFTFLLVAFLLCAVMLVQKPGVGIAIVCGMCLGLAALTRSVLWPTPLILCPLLALLLRGSLPRRILLPGLVLAGFAVVVVPWAVRNTRLQGVMTIVDTMGGMNLRMGNYEHTPDDRMWAAVGLTGEKSWAHGLPPDSPGAPMTEGRKEKWAQKKALEYMRAHPVETARRSLIKFADFWGLEREFIAGTRGGLFVVPRWFEIGATMAIVLAYVAVVIAGAAGIWLAPPHDPRMQLLLLLPLVLMVTVHSIVFGHSRYHLPLVPILAIYGAGLASLGGQRPVSPWLARAGAMATMGVLVAIWVRQIVFVDFGRLTTLVSHAG